MGEKKIMVLATGGTIAGTAGSALDQVGYTAAQLGVAELVDSVPGLGEVPMALEQLAQIDSKDMEPVVWRDLALRCAAALAREDVQGVVVTHGTDTLEETAYFLHRVLPPSKPVVFTCAMRPATALLADGPQNLLDAVRVATRPGVRGVLVVCAGRVHGATDVSKRHSWRLDAFDSGEAGAVAVVEDGAVRQLRDWPQGEPRPDLLERLAAGPDWPRVEIVTSHAGASASIVDALVAQGVEGIVVAATGAGTVHHALLAGLLRARDAGVRVVRASRCAEGRVLSRADDQLPHAGGLSPVKARIDLMLDLMALSWTGRRTRAG